MENLEEIEIGGEEEMVTIDFDPQEGEVIEEVVGQAEGEMGDINEEHPPNLEKMIDFNVSPEFVLLRFFSITCFSILSGNDLRLCKKF